MSADGGQPAPVKRDSGMKLFKRKTKPQQNNDSGAQQEKLERGEGEPPQQDGEQQQTSPGGNKVTPGIQPDGESGRSFFNPVKFFTICWRSSSRVSRYTNLLWPFTIAALVLYFNYPEKQLWIFITSYIGMVPAANLIGFAGQELARKIPKVIGVILETTLGSVVEIILFMVLVTGGERNVPVIRAAILGSILANLLLCLGTMNHINPPEQALMSLQGCASSLVASSGRNRLFTKLSAKWAVISCSSLA